METNESPSPRRRRSALFAAAAAVVALGVAVPTFALGADSPSSTGGTEVQQTTPTPDSSPAPENREDGDGRQRGDDCPFKDGDNDRQGSEGQSEGSALSL